MRSVLTCDGEAPPVLERLIIYKVVVPTFLGIISGHCSWYLGSISATTSPIASFDAGFAGGRRRLLVLPGL